MDAYLLDWVNLLLRWAHVIVAIAWIGSSFYFVFLDNSLTPPTDPKLKEQGVGGELWAVHGGGFYNPQKYLVAPKTLPEHLHWFFWESYSTWLTGFALFAVLYLFNAETFLIDRQVFAWDAPWQAVTAALAFLVVFWLLYDGLCRWLGEKAGKVGGDVKVGIAVTVFVVLASWLACQLFAGRAAFVLVGAMLATAMSANVFFWIIPGQKTVIAQMKAGQPVQAIHGQRAKQRSVHNTYFTLPVLIAMLSNHYSWLYQAPYNWLVLIGMMLGGALIRHSFVIRHKALAMGQPVSWRGAMLGTALIALVAIALAPWGSSARKGAAADAGEAAAPIVLSAENVRQVIDQRCAACHNADLAQKNVALHTPELLAKHSLSVYQQTVVTRQMPMNNATGITEAERDLIRRWYQAGAAASAPASR